MNFKSEKEYLSEMLDDAGGVRFVRYGHLQKNQGILELDWQGKMVRVQVALLEVFEAQPPSKPRDRSRDLKQNSRLMEGQSLTEAQLRAEGLPLYWNAAWLKKALERYGSWAEIERRYGYPNQTLSDYGKKYGIAKRPRLTPERKVRALELLRSGRTRSEVAELTGLSGPSVTRLCRLEGFPPAKLDRRDANVPPLAYPAAGP